MVRSYARDESASRPLPAPLGAPSCPRAELRAPGRCAKPEPHRREHDVERDHRDSERAPPDDPVAHRNPALLPEVPLDAAREPPVADVSVVHAGTPSWRGPRSLPRRTIRTAD